ncbi:MAG: prenyltransferase/squalene oxidase repeat-containing protein [Planctomycetaceae bacterium]
MNPDHQLLLRRTGRRLLCACLAGCLNLTLCGPSMAAAPSLSSEVEDTVTQALDYLVTLQKRQGYWEAEQNSYRVAMTALVGTAMLAEGSTATTGRYSRSLSLAVDYVLGMSRENGLIGDRSDHHYTYGHGFSMLFLSQVYGEEEDIRRREEIRTVLTKAVQFCADAQTPSGGWGYVSAKEGQNFDEGSTCITQVQGLRACRNAGIPVSKEIIDRAIKYIDDCTTSKGGVQYSIRGGGERPPITAAALAALYNAGESDTELMRNMRSYCERTIWPERPLNSSSGHWHYMHFYYAQVIYRQGGERWEKYRTEVEQKLLKEVGSGGGWPDRQVGTVYTTALNCIILQLDKGYLPIYQR